MLLLSAHVSFCIKGLNHKLWGYCWLEYLVYWAVMLKIYHKAWFTYYSTKCVFQAYSVKSTLKVLAFFKSQKMWSCSKNNSKLKCNLRFLLELKNRKLKGHDENLTYYMGWFLICVWGVECIRECLNIAYQGSKIA